MAAVLATGECEDRANQVLTINTVTWAIDDEQARANTGQPKYVNAGVENAAPDQTG